MTPREIIRAEYGDSRNFITPRRLGIGALPGGAYELSAGTGIQGEPIWGVSVVRLSCVDMRHDEHCPLPCQECSESCDPKAVTTWRDTDACQVFHTAAAAATYIRSLKRDKVAA